MSTYDSAGVYIKERDLSAVIVNQSATVAAIVGVFPTGRIDKPIMYTDNKVAKSELGIPDASLSFAMYAINNFFEKGGKQILVQRVVANDALFGACGINDTLATHAQTVADPTDLDWTAIGASGNAVVLISDVGPSDTSNGKSFQLLSRNVHAPTVTATAQTGGSLSTGTQSYVVVARNILLSSGHSAASATATTDSTNKKVQLSWAWDQTAQSYDVYRLVSATYELVKTLGLSDQVSGTFTFVDDGTITPSASKTIALPLVAVTEAGFKIRFFDSSIFLNNPVESYDCTWDEAVDSNGVQTAIEEQINNFSRRFRVYRNPLVEGPVVYTTARTSLAAGSKGSTPTSFQIAAAWDQFADPEAITARVFVNGGYSTPIVQQKMDQVAIKRGDAVGIFDSPPSAQVENDAFALIDYRNNQLNLDSMRSALYAPDIKYADLDNGKVLYIPPSGYVAGVFAFTDYTNNPSFQPAGLKRGQFPNALGVRVKYNQDLRDLLAPAQINPIVNFPGEGIVPWEGLTLQHARSGFSFISIRRIFDTIEVAIKDFLKPEVHDPNDLFTRESILSALKEYLDYWVGQSAINRYAIDIGPDINPGYLTTIGQLNVHILIEPIYPIRFIECTIGLTKAGASFDYLLSGNALS